MDFNIYELWLKETASNIKVKIVHTSNTKFFFHSITRLEILALNIYIFKTEAVK